MLVLSTEVREIKNGKGSDYKGGYNELFCK